MREREYQDSELARRVKDFLIRINFPEKNIHQKGAVLYIRYGKKTSGELEEYVGVFRSENEKRFFDFYIENPLNNLYQTLERELISDKIIRKKGNLNKYKEVFKRIFIGKRTINYDGNQVPAICVTTEIKKIPLGKKKHLSDKFLKWLFEYNIRPFILAVEKHKAEKATRQ